MKKVVVVAFLLLTPLPLLAKPLVTVMVPDENGNMRNQRNGNHDIQVIAGDTLLFDLLSKDDRIIELDARDGVTSQQLCNAAELPEGIAHRVISQTPLPKGLYPKKELSGPYITFPAGIFAMSPSSDECDKVEVVDAECPANTTEVDTFTQNGSRYRLCETSDASNPPCEKGKLLGSIWSDPGVQGVFLRVDWKEVNPAFNFYNWDYVNEAFAKAIRHGKTIMIGIRTGGNSIPDWVFDVGSDGTDRAARVLLKDWGSDQESEAPASCGFNYVVASPSDENFKAHFLRVLNALGRNIRADQRRFSVLSGVKVTGMGQQTLENRLPKRCNIAVRKRGDGENEGHLIDVENTTDLADPKWHPDYRDVTISRRDRCICNPRALKDAGFTPTALYRFYDDVNTTLQENFGYKQKTYMDISQGFPVINDNGRFMGDHLDHYTFDMSVPYDPSSETLHPRILRTAEHAKPVKPENLPDANELTETIVANARKKSKFAGNLDATFGWGVENASLNELPLDLEGGKCRQQVPIRKEKRSPYYGSANFPVPSNSPIDAVLKGCPNKIATEEGTRYLKLTGFQTRNTVLSAGEVDSALWNMTLNTNSVFVELYEKSLWRINIQTSGGSRALRKVPSVKRNIPDDPAERTENAKQAKGKTLEEWNELLLTRASEVPKTGKNHFLHNPFPTSYELDIPKGSGDRFFFNARACRAYFKKGKEVRINRVRYK